MDKKGDASIIIIYILLSHIDVDECLGVNDCHQICINTVGSFNCSCLDGFILLDDGLLCEGIT